MNVYIVSKSDLDESWILAIFDSREKAEKYVNDWLPFDPDAYYIEEWRVQ